MPDSPNRTKNYTLNQHLLDLAKSNVIYDSGLENSLQEITQVSSQALGCERVSIWTFNTDRSTLQLKNLFDSTNQIHSSGPELLTEDFPKYFEYLIEIGLLATDDVTINDHTSELVENYCKPRGILAMFNVPIYYNGKLQGLICHEQIGTSRGWPLEQQAFGISLAELIGRNLEINGRLALQETLVRTNRVLCEKLKEIQEQQKKMNLAFQLSSLGEMAAGIAHEINSPLTTILLRAENLKLDLLKSESDLSSAIAQVDKIATTAERIAKIVKGLKNLSQNNAQDEFVRVKLDTVIAETLDFCRDRFKQRGVVLKISAIPDCELECHPTQITQIFLNLFNNAIDAVEHIKNPWVSLDMSETDENLIFVVTDNGTGIPAHLVEKITEAFFTTKPNGKGTGLGLSISRGIIEEHQGSMNLNQESTQTQFIIEIPKLQVLRKNQSEAA